MACLGRVDVSADDFASMQVSNDFLLHTGRALDLSMTDVLWLIMRAIHMCPCATHDGITSWEVQVDGTKSVVRTLATKYFRRLGMYSPVLKAAVASDGEASVKGDIAVEDDEAEVTRVLAAGGV